MQVPKTIYAGTTLKFTLDLPDYPAGEWTASLIMRGPDQIDFEAESSEPGLNSKKHYFNQSASVSAEWPAGRYWYEVRVTKDAETYLVEDGNLLIKADLSDVNSIYDGRDHVRKVLDSIEAVIEGRASKDQESYKINNRELKRTPINDLILLRFRYKEELRRQNSEKSGSGLLGRAVKVRLMD